MKPCGERLHEGHYRTCVRLNVYRSCSWQEKREVLGAFWHTNMHPSERISQAALEYGPYAVLSIAVIAFELAVIIIFTIIRGSAWGWPAGLLEALVVVSLWWAVMRSRTLKSQFAVQSGRLSVQP